MSENEPIADPSKAEFAAAIHEANRQPGATTLARHPRGYWVVLWLACLAASVLVVP